jgi:hypothetical protein
MKSSTVSQKQPQKKAHKNNIPVTVSKQVVSLARIVKPTAKTAPKKVQSPYIKKFKRYTKQGIKATLVSPVFHVAFKVAVVTLLVSGFMYTSYRVIGKSFANEVVVSQSEIIARVAKLTPVPQEDPEEIVRVQDPEILKKQNSFYNDVKEGDYILMYPNLAVIYDLRSNSIVAVKRNETGLPKF